jgi:hypothetical protein
MVNFAFVALTDPRLTPQLRGQFLRVGQLVEWTLTDSSGCYSGLVVIGEKPHPQGFQSGAEITIDIPAGPGIPIAKVQEISRAVQAAFVERAVIHTAEPGPTH